MLYSFLILAVLNHDDMVSVLGLDWWIGVNRLGRRAGLQLEGCVLESTHHGSYKVIQTNKSISANIHSAHTYAQKMADQILEGLFTDTETGSLPRTIHPKLPPSLALSSLKASAT